MRQRLRPFVRAGEALRGVAGSVLIAIFIAATVISLLGAITTARDSIRHLKRSEQRIAVVSELQLLILDPATGRRATAAGRRFTREAAELKSLSAGADQQRRAAAIARDADSYARACLSDPARPGARACQTGGRQRLDRLIGELRDYVRSERVRQEADRHAAELPYRTIVPALGALSAAAVLIVILGGLQSASLRASRAELATSRARALAAGDAARRRLERDLHDGAQQRLVSLSLDLRRLKSDTPADDDRLHDRLARAVRDVGETIDDLREISHGSTPKILSAGGIEPALEALARHSSIPVELTATIDRRLGEQTEAAVYYVVSEALTNVAKHARASAVHVDIDTEETCVRLMVHDDGVGGADPCRGSGLVGLRDRVESMSGKIKITSPAGEGTRLIATIPSTRPSSATALS